MNLEQNIMQKIKEAMKAKDKKTLEALRAVKSALIIEKTKEGAKDSIDEATELKILQKLVKQRDDSATIYQKENREELASQERFEADVIRKFLPEQLSKDEIETIISEIVANVGASSMKDMGKVMGMANQKMAGRADGKVVSEIVKSLLQ